MVFSQVLSSPKDSSAGKRKAPGQQEVVVRKKARHNDQVERLRKQEESLKEIMMIHMEGSLERMNIRLETERLKLRSQESRQEYELEEMKQREQEMEKSKQKWEKRKQESEKSHQEFLKKHHSDMQSLARKKAKFDSAMLRTDGDSDM
ncbi:Protein of unknown function [Pyronema omphalodes CBS 100304]|uniref:Uncharacterized protein n=1 Tax=Pyronema omphalodes (strain CBS 100304) TaxID=1076935 RepID=U4LN97_PYROM|nr:Protein of unknown function [Pyronema omphalodes CBS 100304]